MVDKALTGVNLNFLNPFADSEASETHNNPLRTDIDDKKSDESDNAGETDDLSLNSDNSRLPNFKSKKIRIPFLNKILSFNKGVIVKFKCSGNVLLFALSMLDTKRSLKIYRIVVTDIKKIISRKFNRLDKDYNDIVEVKELKFRPAKLSKDLKLMFMSEDSRHVFISFQNEETAYFDAFSKQNYFTPIEVLLHTSVECIIHFKEDISTNIPYSFLIGCSTGKLLNLEIDPQSQLYFRIKVMYQFDKSLSLSHISILDKSNMSHSWFDNKVCIFITTKTPVRMYYFYGESTKSCFIKFSKNNSTLVNFLEFPSVRTEIPMAYSTINSSMFSESLSFSILTNVGLFYGSIKFENSSSENISINTKGMCPLYALGDQERTGNFLFLFETNFYYIYSDQNSVRFFSKVVEEISYSQSFSETKLASDMKPQKGISSIKLSNLLTSRRKTSASNETEGAADKILEIITDFSVLDRLLQEQSNSYTFLVCTSFNMYIFELQGELANVWESYRTKAIQDESEPLFKLALFHCSTKAEQHTVYSSLAEFYVASNQLEKAIESYAYSAQTFQSIFPILQSLQYPSTSSKHTLLAEYMELCLSLSSYQQEWILILKTLLQHLFKGLNSATPNSRELETSVLNLINNYSHILAISESYGDILNLVENLEEVFVHICLLVKDFSKLTTYLLSRKNYPKLVYILSDELNKDTSNIQILQLVENFSIEDYINFEELVQLWSICPDINFNNLLPTILSLVEKKNLSFNKLILHFIEIYIYKWSKKDVACHNMYVSLLSGIWGDIWDHNIEGEKSPAKMLTSYLESDSFYADSAHCSDIFEKQGNFKAQALLLIRNDRNLEGLDLIFKTYNTNLDIKNIIKFSKKVATKIYAKKKRKIFWLHLCDLVGNTLLSATPSDFESICVLLFQIAEKSNFEISIEDILARTGAIIPHDTLRPFAVAQMKMNEKEIIRLREAQNQLENILDAEILSGKLRTETKDISTLVCSACHQDLKFDDDLKQSKIFLFPCNHNFHRDCLLRSLSELLTAEEKAHVTVFEDIIEEQLDNSSEVTTLKQKAEDVLCRFMAKSCPYCGDIRVRSLAHPFLTDSETDTAKGWNI